MKEYKLRIGTKRPTKIKGWDLLDVKVKYLKKIGLWNNNDRTNQTNLEAVVVITQN